MIEQGQILPLVQKQIGAHAWRSGSASVSGAYVSTRSQKVPGSTPGVCSFTSCFIGGESEGICPRTLKLCVDVWVFPQGMLYQKQGLVSDDDPACLEVMLQGHDDRLELPASMSVHSMLRALWQASGATMTGG